MTVSKVNYHKHKVKYNEDKRHFRVNNRFAANPEMCFIYSFFLLIHARFYETTHAIQNLFILNLLLIQLLCDILSNNSFAERYLVVEVCNFNEINSGFQLHTV